MRILQGDRQPRLGCWRAWRVMCIIVACANPTHLYASEPGHPGVSSQPSRVSNRLVSNTKLDAGVIEVVFSDRTVRGKLLAYDDRQLVLLQRDGRMHTIKLNADIQVRQLTQSFVPCSTAGLRQVLARQVPAGYEVTNTGHYVVIHPTGKSQQWALPFEQLYRKFTQYFHVRGFRLREPEFPLIVMVYASHGQFLQKANQQKLPHSDRLSGFYSPQTNHILTYDSGSGLYGDTNPDRLTLIHEALHQFAFNRGVHNRWSPTPRWLSEGIAVMFEARGVYDPQTHTRLVDRVHPIFAEQVDQLIADDRATGYLEQLVAADDAFSQDPQTSYALAWAATFYLAEKQPGDWNKYLRTIGQRESFRTYSAEQRLDDFARHFGTSFQNLEARINRFVAEQRPR